MEMQGGFWGVELANDVGETCNEGISGTMEIKPCNDMDRSE